MDTMTYFQNRLFLPPDIITYYFYRKKNTIEKLQTTFAISSMFFYMHISLIEQYKRFHYLKDF